MAQIDYLVSLDLNQNELLYPRIHNLGTAPASPTPVEGQLYMNTTDHNLYVYDGTGWVDLTSQGSGSTNLTTSYTATTVVIESSTGTDATINLANGTTAGVSENNLTDAFVTILGNTSGTNTGDQTATLTAGVGLSGTTYDPDTSTTFNLDFTELTDMTAAISGTTEFILNDAGTESRKAASEIDLSAFNDDIGIITDQPAIIASGGLPSLFTGITATEVQQLLNLEVGVDIDPAGTDNSTDVTLAGSLDYITIAGQVITRNAITFEDLDASDIITQAEGIQNNDNDTTIPTSAAVKDYVDSAVTGALVYQGGYDAATDTPSLDDGTPIAGILTGWTYTVTVAGDFFTEAVQVGDMLVAEIDSPTVLADWTIVNKNIPDIVDASETAKGLVEEATDAEVTAGTATGSTGAKLFITPEKLATYLGVSGTLTTPLVYTELIGNGASTSIAVTHSIGRQHVQSEVFDASTGDKVICEVENTSTTQTTFKFNVAPATDALRVVIMG